MVARAASRPRSATMSTGRLASRSTQTPAGRPTRMNGRNSTVVSRPTSKVVAFRTVMAISGRASMLTWLPSRLMVCPAQSFMKSPWRHRLRFTGPVSCGHWEKSIDILLSMRDRREASAQEARALANPLRLRILRLCLERALTNKELADRLGKDPATVLHHVRTLVDTGFLAADPVRTGAKGALEKPYRATGKSWEVNVGETADEAHWLAGIDALRDEVQEAGPPDPMVAGFRLGIRLSPERLAALVERLDALGDEYAFKDDEDGEPLGFSVFLHRRKL